MAYTFETYQVPANTRDISPEVLDDEGRMRVLPASYWRTTTREERGMFGVRNGIYSFPTTELVDYLRTAIGGRRAIEVGAGNGVLAKALDIIATDSYQQAKRKYQQFYERTRQPTVNYGSNVIKIDGNQAVRKFRPEVVIGCWVTYRYDEARPEAGGNEAGVDELDILNRAGTYILVGNDKVHSSNHMWDLPHEIIYPDWLYSRALNGTRDFIATWRR